MSAVPRVLLATASLVLLFGAPPARSQARPPQPGVAVLDLRAVDFTRHSPTLDGEWALYWGRLLTRADSAEPTAIVAFPRRWTETQVGGRTLQVRGVATYSVLLRLPANHPPLALQVPTVYTAHRLYVNGVLVAQSGRPDTSAVTAMPKWITQVVAIDAPADTLRVVLQVANYWHAKGGPFQSIRIGAAERLAGERADETARAWLLTGTLIAGGLFFLGLFVFGERDRATLYFALFCLLYSYRVVGADPYLLHDVWASLPFAMALRLEYVSLFAAIGVFSVYHRHLFPLDVHHGVLRAIAALCGAFAAVTVVTPTVFFTRLIEPFLLPLFLGIAYVFVIYVRAARRRRLGARTALASSGVLLASFTLINLEYFGVLTPNRALVESGYFAFFFLQSLILTFRFARTLTEAKQQALEGLRAKADFLSTMSHEIRTPLNAVLGVVDLLRVESPREDQRRRLDILHDSATNLLSIVNDVLDYSKIEAGKVTFERVEFNLGEMVTRLADGQRANSEQKGVALAVEVDPALVAPVLGDPGRLAQVLNNLVANAIKFTERGQVTLSVRPVEIAAEHLMVRLSVRDTGIGIAAEQRAHIFERFTQADASTSRRFGGTGLGLAICRRLLALQGVELELESTPGVGSDFWFIQTFPRVAEAAAPMAAEGAGGADHPPSLSGVRVLLAEDNAVNVLVARAILERYGARVDVASNGQEALQQLDPEGHHVVLTDLHMPVMDGRELAVRIRAKGAGLPIVAITASTFEEPERWMREHGFDALLVKPYRPEDLLRVLGRVLDRARKRGG